MADDFGHCLALLRDADPDRYLSVLYLPQAARAAAAAIHAFDAEIARIPSLVSGPMPGEMRLAWWREVVEGDREPGNSPVARALVEAVDRHNLPRAPLVACLEARRFDLYHDPMPDRATLEGYCGETCSAPLNLVALCAGAAPGETLAQACGHGGVALAVARLVRRCGRDRAAGRCYFPRDILGEAGLAPEQWLDQEPGEAHLRAVGAMAAFASGHLEKARASIARLPGAERTAFLVLATTPALLEAARRAGTGLYTAEPEIAPLRRHGLFWRAAIGG